MKHGHRFRQRLLGWTTLFVVAALGIVAVPVAPFGVTGTGTRVVYGQELSQARRVFLPLIRKQMEAQTGSVTSSQSNVISTPSGVRMTVLEGTVPRQQSGAESTTTFSIESGVTPPAPLPADAQLVSPIIKLGPEGFTFASPVAVNIPIALPPGVDPLRLRLLRYEPATGTWVPYPIGLESNSVSFAAYDLGYIALVLAPPATPTGDDSSAGAGAANGEEAANLPVVVPPPEPPLSTDESASGVMDGEPAKEADKAGDGLDEGSPQAVDGEPAKEAEEAADGSAVVATTSPVPLAWLSGGVRWNRTRCPPPYEYLNCWYNFTIIRSTSMDTSPAIYNSDCTQAGGERRCIAMRTGSDATGVSARCYHEVMPGDTDPDFYEFTREYCVFHLPRGTYEFCAEAWETPQVIPSGRTLKRWTYSRPARANVDRAMYRNSGDPRWIGTRPIVLDPGGTWEPSSACPRPAPTIPVGTGELQATLSWVNTSTRATDLDLHLYGPGGLHIYYSNKGPQNNLRLDRDWQRELGNATENIYSVGSPIPRGEYRLTVKLYIGAPTNYSVRFLFRGSVRSFSNTITRVGEEQEILRFTVP